MTLNEQTYARLIKGHSLSDLKKKMLSKQGGVSVIQRYFATDSVNLLKMNAMVIMVMKPSSLVLTRVHIIILVF